jgi:hypothetical protein
VWIVDFRSSEIETRPGREEIRVPGLSQVMQQELYTGRRYKSTMLIDKHPRLDSPFD